MSPLLFYAIPVFVLLLLLEVLLLQKSALQKKSVRGYEWKDTLASLAMGLGSMVAKMPFVGALFILNSWLYQYRIFDIPSTWWSFALLIVAEDLCYYWFHRFHHQIRFLWAGHVSHHSSQHYNLSTALRQPWTTVLSGPIFWLPLPLLGFDPTAILTAQAISLIYQFWIHTELIGHLGPIEWIFNTPSHHRVHHGSNPQYLDRNHGGIFIIWDKLFKTFEPEIESVNYGLTSNIESFHPLTICFHEFKDILRDLRKANRLPQALGYLFRSPGWSPEKKNDDLR